MVDVFCGSENSENSENPEPRRRKIDNKKKTTMKNVIKSMMQRLHELTEGMDDVTYMGVMEDLMGALEEEYGRLSDKHPELYERWKQ